MRLTKFNPEKGRYEYITKPTEYVEYRAVTLAALQRLGEFEDKASDVAEEIFAEIEQNLNNLIRYYKEKRKYVTEIEYSEFEQMYCDIKIRTFEERLLKIAELKKKYIGKDTNVTTNTEEGK